MRGGALPPALICAALGFALAFAPRRALGPSFLALVAAAIGASMVRLNSDWDDGVFLGCWLSVMLTAGAVHLPKVGFGLAVALAANAGVWAGVVVAAAGAPVDLLKALPLALLCFPGGWLVATGRSVVIKVLASWLIAVAVLAAALSIAPITSGYEPDHLE